MNTLVARFSRSIPALLAALVLGHAVMALARAGGIQGHGCPECGCAVCHPVQVPVKEKQHCWEVECKQICIPAVRWPWEKCCEPRCGKVKTVKVLKRVDYECTKCGYKWEIQAVDCCPCGK
jgi:hypothetical protein